MIVELATVSAMYMADASAASPMDYLNPVSVAISVTDKVTGYVEQNNKVKPKSQLSQEKLDSFKLWAKEDFYKDDPYKEMWDQNWIRK